MTRDRISGAILIAFALFVVWESRTFPIGTMQRPGPGYMPILLMAGLGLAGGIILFWGGKSPRLRSLQWPEWRHAAAILAICIFMCLLLEKLGYRITVALMLAFLIKGVEKAALEGLGSTIQEEE